MKNTDYEKYLDYLLNNLIKKGTRLDVALNRDWSRDFVDKPGVYVFFENDTVAYAGETASIKKRMRDVLNTRNHTLRRKIGNLNFFKITGYEKASSKKKFIPEIEKLIDERMIKEMKFSFIQVNLGRKELEELIIRRYKPKYNSPLRRGEDEKAY